MSTWTPLNNGFEVRLNETPPSLLIRAETKTKEVPTRLLPKETVVEMQEALEHEPLNFTMLDGGWKIEKIHPSLISLHYLSSHYQQDPQILLSAGEIDTLLTLIS